MDIRLDRDGYRISAWDRHERAPLVVDTSTDGAATRLSQLFSWSDQLVIGGGLCDAVADPGQWW